MNKTPNNHGQTPKIKVNPPSSQSGTSRAGKSNRGNTAFVRDVVIDMQKNMFNS